MPGVLGELKRRNVFKVAVIYVIAAWAILQVADVLLPALRLPEWTLSFVAALLLLGFPMALVFSWVFELTSDGLMRTETVPTGRSKTHQTGRKLDFLIIGILAVAVVVLLVRQSTLEPPSPAADPATDSVTAARTAVAVMPFVNMSDDASNQYFSDGISEELLNVLVKVPGLAVVGRTSSFALRDQALDLREIGRQLNATHILEGSVRKSGNSVRITAQLIKASDGYHLWSETYDRDLTDIFEVQDQISRAITKALQVELLPDTLAAITDPVTRSPEAFDLYLQGQALLREGTTVEHFDAAIDRFGQALERDPVFSSAEAGLCRALFAKYWQLRDSSLIDEAIDTCDRAATRDPEQIDVHLALGRLYRGTGRSELAERAFSSAIELAPDNVEAIRGLADTLSEAGEMDRAEHYFTRALDLEPANARNHGNFAVALFRAGRLEESIPLFQEAIRLQPSEVRYYSNLGGIYIYLGRFDAAARIFEQAVAISPSPQGYGNAGTNYYYAADYERAIAMYGKAIAMAPSDFRWHGNLADACRRSPLNCEEPATAHYARARARAEAHLAIDPADAIAQSFLALYQARLGEHDGARGSLTRAIRMQPNAIEVLWAAALVRELTGDLDAAATALELAMQQGYPELALRSDPDLVPVFDHLERADVAQ